MTPPDPGQPQYPPANLEDRVSAFLIDAVMIFAIIVVLNVAIGPIVADLISNHRYSKNVDDLISIWDALGIEIYALMVVLFCSTVLVQVIWGGLLEGIWGLTPGKAALRLKRKPVKLKVVSADDHNQTIGFARGVFREIIRPIPYMLYLLFLLLDVEQSELLYGVLLLLSVLVFVLDHLWPRWDEERQALHDKIANSHVVNTHEG